MRIAGSVILFLCLVVLVYPLFYFGIIFILVMSLSKYSNTMHQLKRLKEKTKANIRYIIGGISLLLGGLFMFIPFIPLGYVFLGVGAFLLSPAIPALKRLINFAEKKDPTNKVKKMEEKTDELIKDKIEKK